MQLERIGVVLRPRVPQEAIDLGLSLVRAHARPVWSAWFAFTLPIFLLCQTVAVAFQLPWLGWLLFWWLLPLCDRVPLYVLSRAVFEKAPSWREALRGQWRWPWSRTLAALTYLRIDSNRTLRLPLDFLEGVTGAQRAARWRVLRKPLIGVTSTLTYVCIMFELILFLSSAAFAIWLVPTEVLQGSFVNIRAALQQPAVVHTLVWIASVLAYLVVSAIEPLYVAAGFALYLNRRTQLEAWDIDLSFRRLRQRLLQAGASLIVLCAFGLPLSARAAVPPAATPPVANLQQVFHEPRNSLDSNFADQTDRAYSDASLGGEHKVQHWVLKWKPSEQQVKPTQTPDFNFGNLASTLFNLLVWSLLAAVIIGLVLFAVRALGRVSLPSITRSSRTLETLQQQSVVEAPLPDDLANATRDLWRQGRRREALALLYRGSVQHAATMLDMPAPIDATESDWLRHAAAINESTQRERLVAIVRTWQLAAYADRYPDDAAVDRLLTGWPAQPAGAA